MDPWHHVCQSCSGFGELKMKGYGSEMRSAHNILTSEFL